MSWRRTASVTRRVLRQIRRDKRFLILVLVVPFVLIFFVENLFAATSVPPVQQQRFAVPFGAYIAHFATFILTAIVLVRERVTGTLERMFVNGYRRAEIVTGYLGGYTILGTAISAIVLAALQVMFDLGYGLGQLLEAFVVVWMLAVISMALGILVSNAARTEGQVIPFIPLVIIPSFLFSGIVVAVELLPLWARVISRISPMYYANLLIERILMDEAVTTSAVGAVGLPLFGVLILGAATLTLRESA